ncbi:hypothetical protein [Desulfosporosinus metallidurans]|uniref:hypothetical protein n=1 Tax=Desulfosporosinus metallidurans TaxID=1888891 RepID=UPI00094BEEE4|nr:hypothetical protein [Desulfosporosinus metallidurans]
MNKANSEVLHGLFLRIKSNYDIDNRNGSLDMKKTKSTLTILLAIILLVVSSTNAFAATSSSGMGTISAK